MKGNQWARLLSYVTGLVNQELLLRNEYLSAEDRILRAHLPARLRLSDPERRTLAEIGKRLGRKALEKVACAAKPDTAGTRTCSPEPISFEVLTWRGLATYYVLFFLHSNSSPAGGPADRKPRWSPTLVPGPCLLAPTFVAARMSPEPREAGEDGRGANKRRRTFDRPVSLRQQ
jgi:hypothetical protein